LGDSKCGYLQKETKDETEQLESSSITEEFGVPQNPSYSSDNTENSNKRKRNSSFSNATRVQGGNILRIRLPSQKNIQCDINDGGKQLCSTAGRSEPPDAVATRVEPDKTCTTSLASARSTQSLPIGPANDLRQLNTDQTPLPQEDLPISEHVSKRHKKMQRVGDKYTNLFENWTPPSQLVQCSDADDQDWLFARKNKQMQKQPDINNGVMHQISCSSSSSLWPSAQYLPGADIYCLPYTIPF
jgi:hypothetical protein